MNKNANDYLESLFTGVQILIDKELENVSYDTTIICTVVENNNSKNGEYRVTDGSTVYTAYSDVSTYIIGDQVRVTIPMGDYTQKKFISGKYIADNDSNPITYISPADTIMNISGNLITSIHHEGIVANGKDKSRVLWNKRLDSSFIAMQDNNIYNTIILKAEFKTLLNNYDLIAGNYGLRLDFLVRPSAKSSVLLRRYVELDSQEMFGNPYSFSIYSPQSKVIKINTIGIIEGIELSLYQRGNFKDRIQGVFKPFNETIDDILINNVVLGLGCDLGTTEDNTLQIYSENDMSYVYGNHNNTTNLKTMGLLWLNKDEHNQYIGFSDGIYDPDYDELKYLELAKGDIRLTSQKGREGVPQDKTSLTLAANIEEAETAILKATEVVTKDLIKILRELLLQVEDIALYKNNINQLIDKLVSITDSIKLLLNNTNTGKYGMVQQYRNILKYGYETWMEVEHTIDAEASFWNINYGSQIQSKFNEIIKEVSGLLETKKEGQGFYNIDKVYSGLKSIYDTYYIRINRILAIMKGYLGISDENYPSYQKVFPAEVFTKDYGILQKYKNKNKENFILYKELDLSEYANKYCIYWYRYEKDYIAPDTEQIMPDGWRRLTPGDKNAIPPIPSDFDEPHGKSDDDGINIGLPKDKKDILNAEGKPLYAPKVKNGKGLLKRYMQNDLEQEKYVAVLFYNHNMYKSNELVFTNSEVIPDKTTLDKGDILIFEHLTNSADDFQSYNITNYLMDASDENRIRQIRCHYDGLLAKDNAFVNGRIYWYVPAVSTMLTVDIDDLIQNKGFTLDDKKSSLDNKGEGKTGYIKVNFQQKNRNYEANKYYKLEDGKYTLCLDEPNPKNAYGKPENITYYEKSYLEYCFYKTIKAEKIDKDAEYEWDKWSYVTDNIDNRDFWYKIKPYYEESAVNNEIRCEFIQHEDVDSVKGVQLFTFGVKGTSGTKYTLAITKVDGDIASTASQGLRLRAQLKDFNNNILSLPSGSDGGFNVQWDFVKKISDDNEEPPTIDNLIVGVSEATFNGCPGAYGTINCTARIMIKGENIQTSDNPPVDITATTDNTAVGKLRNIDLNVVYAIPYSNGDYYIQGPTQIIYNSLGSLDNMSMFNTPYKLFAKKDIGDNIKQDQEINNITWEIVYHVKKNNEWIELSNSDPRKTFYSNYMPKIQNNNLIPSPIYISNAECYASVLAKNSKGDILWRQPIIILQNRYGSSMLNDWDGTLQINEDNGTIMSTMIGAGRKTSNNTFEGVLMGDVALGTESNIGFENGNNIGLSNQTGLGIYGFHNGAQSFGFNVDGTAFLGKSGAGRIIFNGDYGAIASANWFTGVNEATGQLNTSYQGTIGANGIQRQSNAGMYIDLKNGHIDAYNFKLTSKNIYLNSNPTADKDYYLRIGSDGTAFRGQIGQERTGGYLALDKNGNLDIKVNSLTITEMLGGANLLNQTQPTKTTPQYQLDAEKNPKVDETGEKLYQYDNNGNVKYYWDVDTTLENPQTSQWSSTENTKVDGTDVIYKNNTENSDNPKRSYDYICISTSRYIDKNDSSKSKQASIYQIVKKIKPGKKYTISGYVRRKNSRSDDPSTFNVTISNSKDLAISDANLNNGNVLSITNKEWFYFERNVILNTTIRNKEIKITFESPVDFYLYHAKFEEGSVATDWSLSRWDIQQGNDSTKNTYDQYLTQDKIFKKLITNPTNGERMNGIWLVNGKNSASGRTELYINATYISSGILRSSNWNGKFRLKDTGTKDKYGNSIKTFELTNKPTTGMYINLDTGDIWSKHFKLHAWDSDKGIYLSSAPDNSQTSYFRVGNSNNYLRFYQIYDEDNKYTGDKFDIKSSIFTLNAGTKDTSDYIALFSEDQDSSTEINGTSQSTWRIIAGTNFGVAKDGTLYAKSANITGTITGSTITGGTISGTSISGGTISGGTISGSSISGGTISGSSISGGTISGGSVTGSTITGGSVSGSSISCTGGKNGGTIDAKAGTIGGWTINQDSISSGANESKLVLNSDGSILVGTTKITSSGFFDTTTSANYPSKDNVLIWSGWGSGGGWGKIAFRNGLFVSYTNTGFDAGEGDSSVFKYTVTTNDNFQIDEKGSAWTLSYNNTNTGSVAADGKFLITCILTPPTTLYKQGSSHSITKLGSAASKSYCYFYYDETTKKVKQSWSKPGSSVPYDYIYGYFGNDTVYHAGSSVSYNDLTEYCNSGSQLIGKLQIKLS